MCSVGRRGESRYGEWSCTSQNCIVQGILRDIAELIKREEKVHIDIIAAELKTDSAGLLMKLTELEMLGYIRSCPGRIYEANF